jgi:hypothetical protein
MTERVLKRKLFAMTAFPITQQKFDSSGVAGQ